jgi:hypothetical protein
MNNDNINWISGVANPDEIERFQYGYSLTRPMTTPLSKKKYIIPVQKIVSGTIEIEAESLEEAKQKAEYLKNNMMLNWR